MSGHSKWSNIKRKKGAADAQRAKLFTKIGREIQVAVRAGGPDPEVNRKLKDVVAKAKASNMPNDNIMRSIKKAAGSSDADQFEEIQYEGYGAAGVAFMVRALTDNRNRTAADVRHLFDKFGGNMGTTGCVSFMFSPKGQLIIEAESESDSEQVMLDALESGADDFEEAGEVYVVTTAPEAFDDVVAAMAAKGYVFAEASVSPVPDNYVSVTDAEQAERLEKLIDALEDNDDVQDVYHNWDN